MRKIMRTIETIRQFQRRHFSVVVTAVEDHDADLSWADKKTLRQIESGELQCFGVIVRVFVHGNQLATDSLWGCVYKSPRDFMDHFNSRPIQRKYQRREDNKAKRENRAPMPVSVCCYFSEMIRGAIAEARKQIEAIKEL